MVDRPILRFLDPVSSARRTGAPRSPPRPRGPGRARQGRRFQSTFDGLADALATDDPEFVLREDPAGIAPERALVFITAGSVQNFARAARQIGLEVFAETELDEMEDFPEGFEPAGDADTLSRTLYATMPTLDSFRRILALWNAHQRGENAPRNASPWWTVFDLLLELRPWGPEDRLAEGARAVIADRLPFDEDEEVPIEFEIWPTASAEKRATWARETERQIDDLGGRVIDRSSIAESGFAYEAVLAGLPVSLISDLASELERSPAQIAQWITASPGSAVMSIQAGEVFCRLIEILDALLELYDGDLGGALHWLTAPNVVLSNERPVEGVWGATEQKVHLSPAPARKPLWRLVSSGKPSFCRTIASPFVIGV